MPSPDPALRHDWTVDEVLALLDASFPELMWRAQSAHRAHHDAGEVEFATLLSIKTGGCPEDCAYCPQSVHHDAAVAPEALVGVERVRTAAREARESGATRFCMGAAWRRPTDRQVGQVIELIDAVHAEGLESCVTLGMLSPEQAGRLADAGLDYYNHNLDTSPEHYGEIISTRTYDERLDTLAAVRDAGIHVCCGGIVGLGEARRDRAALLVELANQPQHPESVPINALVRVEGTPLADAAAVDDLEFVRTIAAARVLMPASVVRLAAGREGMAETTQALCFLAGANSIFSGERLLTTPNPQPGSDADLLARLGLRGRVTAGEAPTRESGETPARMA
jgi:biotin synthase